MSESHDVSASRLSGQWVGLTEALAWVVTRDFKAARTLGTSIGPDLYPKMAVHAVGAETPSMMTATEAKTSLLEATRQGWVDAKGTPGNQFDPQGQRVNIDAADWAKLYIGAGDRTFIVRSISGVMNPQFWHDVLLRSDQLVAAFPAPTRPVPDTEKHISSTETLIEPQVPIRPQREGKSTMTQRPRRGRSKTYPWPHFEAEALRKLGYEGGVGAVTGFLQADLERYMAEWCSKNWERQPAESTMREHVASVLKSYEAGKGQ